MAFLLLPKPKRMALQSLYRYCRHIDDMVDEAPSFEIAQQNINQWKKILDRIFHLSPSDPALAHDLNRIITSFGVRVEDLFWILNGMEMDLQKSRYETFPELLEYCDAVASAVGLAMMPIFGVERDVSYNYAMSSGRALQMTNILRDVASDVRRGRVYLPQEDMRRFNYTDRHLELGIYNDEFMALMEFQLSRTLGFYIEAEKNIPSNHRRALVPAEAMRKIYLELLKRIDAKKYRVFPEKITIPTSAKARVFVSQMVANFFPVTFPV